MFDVIEQYKNFSSFDRNEKKKKMLETYSRSLISSFKP